MREIMFRGKRRDTGEWVEGLYIYLAQTDEYLISDKEGLCEIVDSETVGQFTGLTDKNSTRIFEGDIVDIDIGYLKRRGVVFYEESAAKFGLEMEGAEKNFSFLGRQMVKMYNVTVIGNIHDNPELIGERKDNG